MITIQDIVTGMDIVLYTIKSITHHEEIIWIMEPSQTNAS